MSINTGAIQMSVHRSSCRMPAQVRLPGRDRFQDDQITPGTLSDLRVEQGGEPIPLRHDDGVLGQEVEGKKNELGDRHLVTASLMEAILDNTERQHKGQRHTHQHKAGAMCRNPTPDRGASKQRAEEKGQAAQEDQPHLSGAEARFQA
jgi:hypothetical protein